MSKREKIILIVTVAVAVVALLYRFGLSGLADEISSTSERMTRAQQAYDEYQRQLDKQSAIEGDYRKIEGQFSTTDPNRKPDQAFTEDVARLCRELGLNYPRIEPVQDAEIPEVDEYKFMTVEVKSSGDLEQFVKLLKGFEQRSLLITALKITHPPNAPSFILSVTVARIVKLTPDELNRKEEKGRLSTRSRLRSSVTQPRGFGE